MAEIKILEKKWMERFAYNLERAMSDAGMNQAELARKSGLPTGTISRYLAGDRSPKAYHVGRIAEALGTRTDDLCGNFPHF